MPILRDEADKNLIPKELCAIYYSASQTKNYGSSWNINQVTADTMDVREVGEGAEIPMDAISEENRTLTPVKYGVAIRITREMVEDSQFDLFARNIKYAGKRMAEKETELIITALHATTNAVSGGAAITIANIAEGMNYLERYDYMPTDILIGDEVLQDLRNIDTFVEADKAGNTDMMKTGFIGTLFGMKAARFSRNATPTPTTYCKYAYIIDRSNAYTIGYKRDITVENFELPTYDMSGACITMRVDVKYLRDYATCEITTS